jgi:hypothetical protein
MPLTKAYFNKLAALTIIDILLKHVSYKYLGFWIGQLLNFCSKTIQFTNSFSSGCFK